MSTLYCVSPNSRQVGKKLKEKSQPCTECLPVSWSSSGSGRSHPCWRGRVSHCQLHPPCHCLFPLPPPLRASSFPPLPGSAHRETQTTPKWKASGWRGLQSNLHAVQAWASAKPDIEVCFRFPSIFWKALSPFLQLHPCRLISDNAKMKPCAAGGETTSLRKNQVLPQLFLLRHKFVLRS